MEPNKRFFEDKIRQLIQRSKFYLTLRHHPRFTTATFDIYAHAFGK